MITIDSDNDYVPPEPVYEPGSPRHGPPREDGSGAPNIFTDSARARVRGRGREIPVQCVAPFFRGSGTRRNFLGRVRPV